MKSLIAVAIVGATLAVAGGAVAKPGNFDAPLSPIASSQVGPQKFAAPKHCKWPRISVRLERMKLTTAGYRKIKYTGKKTFLPRCAKFLYFSACKNAKKYRVIVRYIGFNRYVIAQPQGNCLLIYTPGVFKK